MSSAAPWIIGCGLAVVFVLAWLDYFRVDVKFRIWRDPSFATSGSFPASDSWVTDRPAKDVLQLARHAIEGLGGTGVVQVDTDRVYGWVGNRYTNTNIAKFAQYQVLVSAEDDHQGHVDVICSVRPRYRRLIGSRRYSWEWLHRLSRDLLAVAVTTQPPPQAHPPGLA